MRPRTLVPLKLGDQVLYISKKLVCDKEVKLWSDFNINRIPGVPTELQQSGNRSTYVTSFSYKIREIDYREWFITKVPRNADDEKRIEYPEPKS